jgi:hypothetical protein
LNSWIVKKKHLLLLGVALAAAPVANAQNAVGEVFSGDASVRGSVLLSGRGTHVLSGSQVTAGDGAAVLKLERGGELRICPKTNLSLSADAAGKALVLGLNAGAMELNYSLPTAADLLLTPDFRLQLISPGSFHLAISVAADGDTCLRSLAGNDAAVFIAEAIGSDSYQLSPGKSVMFRAGKISGATQAPAVCGCPERTPEMVAKSEPAATAPETPKEMAKDAEAVPEHGAAAVAEHVEMDSTFAYRGDKSVQDYYGAVARLSTSTDNSQLALALLPKVSGPQAEAPQAAGKKDGRLRRLRKFFAGLFTE